MRSFVLDLDEEEAARRRGGAGCAAIACGENLWDSVGGEAVGGRLDEGADEVANHVVEEAGSGDAVDEEVFLLVPGGVVDGADVRDGAGVERRWRSGFLHCSGKCAASGRNDISWFGLHSIGSKRRGYFRRFVFA